MGNRCSGSHPRGTLIANQAFIENSFFSGTVRMQTGNPRETFLRSLVVPAIRANRPWLDDHAVAYTRHVLYAIAQTTDHVGFTMSGVGTGEPSGYVKLGIPLAEFQVACNSRPTDRGAFRQGMGRNCHAGQSRILSSLLRKEPCSGVAWPGGPRSSSLSQWCDL